MYLVPLALTPRFAPPGAPCIKTSWNRLWGNMSIRGTKFPAAFMRQSAIVFFPCSADDAVRTCLTPFVASTLPGLTTVLMPVSSQFHTLVTLKLPPFSSVSSNTCKNALTAFSVKPLIRARLVAMAFLKPLSQSFPAFLMWRSNLCLACKRSANSYAILCTSSVVTAYIPLSINWISCVNICSTSLDNTFSMGSSFRLPGVWTARSQWWRKVLLGILYCTDAWAIVSPLPFAWSAFWRESRVDLRF